MADDNPFFRAVRDFCQRDVVTCAAGDRLVDAVGIMRSRNISSIVVVRDDMPHGIFTDRDLRNKVVAQARDPAALTVADVMHTPLSTIAERDVLYEALYRMSKQKIHRLVVVDDTGRLTGIITDTDILRLQAHSPHQLVLDIEKAGSIDDLRHLHHRIQQLVVHMSGTGIAIRDLVKLIANLNDQVLIRLIGLLRAEKYPDLTDRFAFVVMGSEGRSEQTLSTDQDNAIVYADDLSADELARLEAFSVELIDTLIAIGVPPCPGGIMAKNAAWRHSLSEWKQTLNRWLTTPTPEHVMTGSMFMDLRTLYGPDELVQALREQAFRTMSQDQGFLMRMAQNMTRFLPPLSWLGRIKVEKSGPHRGKLDIKKAGIFAITDGIKALAIQARALDGSTHDRIEALVAAKVMKEADAADLRAAFDFMVRLRLRGHVEALHAGTEPSNYISLEQLNAMEKGELKLAFEGVARFQGFIKHHFSLQLLRN
ncbi:CBS domain-containing protein [Azoarcus sp. L1K30]|uniref:putative nucleotidyltransferase substrate binding domain-containing protein n=1 Tax=Azoarcus sp. L1K30 TaxID=2820277 RepID=UPI001B83CE56|nr:putative nucleotidyltransferase substrate binding domain-containing protein [Azoarcus sp. L1K30]MBR0565775.1 CBS domain-containing protein [Azoarcus sp. L1K30]